MTPLASNSTVNSSQAALNDVDNDDSDADDPRLFYYKSIDNLDALNAQQLQPHTPD